MKGKEVVILVNKNPEVGQRPFDKDHAERILKRTNPGGWELPKQSEYKFTAKDGLTKRSNSGSTEEPKK